MLLFGLEVYSFKEKDGKFILAAVESRLLTVKWYN